MEEAAFLGFKFRGLNIGRMSIFCILERLFNLPFSS
jgi:hypothetical protein